MRRASRQLGLPICDAVIVIWWASPLENGNTSQEPREFTLPNSRLVVHYSTRFYKFASGDQNIIAPDQQACTFCTGTKLAAAGGSWAT